MWKYFMIKTDPVHSGGGFAAIKQQTGVLFSCIVPNQEFIARQVVTLAYVLTNTILMFQSL
jgi:hypothetical protein